MASTADYVELRTRSAFSFLEGATLPEELAERAAALRYPALALGDRDGMYGQPRFYHAAQAAGIKPIVGAELTLEDRSRLYVLVPDRARYRNLCRMITSARLRAPKGKGYLTIADLERYGQGLICLAGGAHSPLTRALLRGNNPAALAQRLKTIFGSTNLFIDLQRHLDPNEERLNRKLITFAEALRIPLTVSNDVCHAKCDRRLADVLTCVRLHTTLEEAGRALWINSERHLKAPAEIAALFRDLPRALGATREIAARCEFTLADLGYRFPDYPLPPGETAQSYLRVLIYAGARERWGGELEHDPRIRRQLEHELSLIGRLGLAGYFFIVWDIVRFCRESGTMVQGRGSAANSAVCYALGITAIDAVRMELLFERFLSEERGEWPDIDLDLPSGEQRERVIQYVYQRYSARGAAMTANVITYRTRSAVREAAKVLGFPPEQIDRLARLSYVYEFRDRHDQFAALLRQGGVDPKAPRIRLLVELVQHLQGLPRHLGQHSGGMAIAAGELDELVPLEPAAMPNRVVLQWDKDDCADLKIIKIDLLGLGMLAVLEEAIPLIRAHERVEIDLAHLPQDDPATYDMISRADTVGVFQIESRAQMATLPRLKPRRFYDLVVAVAIIRPGPIVGRAVHPYLNRRAGRAPVTYPHPALKPILERTLGVPLFQEQLLRIAMTLAGFSPGAAEELHRAMGFKRSHERMAQLGQRLHQGLAKNGISGSVADEVIQSITAFALYGFPESHAASFALLAYASAFIRCHHPAAYTAAMLNCWPLGFYSPATLIQDAKRHGVEVRPIDICHSGWQCSLERNQSGTGLALRLGLRYARGLRREIGENIERERMCSPFRSIADFAARSAANRRELNALAYLGALGSFGLTRREALWQVAATSREPLFAGAPLPTSSSPLPPMAAVEETLADYAATGLTLKPHLLTHLRAALTAVGVFSTTQLAQAENGAWVKVAGAVIVRQRPATAKGFLFLSLEDEGGIANVVVTPGLFERHRVLLSRAALLQVEGPLQKVEGVIHIRARRFRELTLPAPLPPARDFH
jgi:error-prone DNA polymerase